MDLSVIIVSFNARDYLKQCLLSVIKASENSDCEIIVVDNNSPDDSCNMVSQEFPSVIIIRNSLNSGFSAANNQGIKISRGRFILLLNPDTIVGEDTLRKCIRFMENHPEAGAAGVRMVDGNGRFLPESKRSLPDAGTAFFKIFGFTWLFPSSALFSRYYVANTDNSETTPVEVISGAFMFLRREAIEKTGYLDEDYFMYGEDIDISYRLIKAGFTNYYFTDTQIVHFKGMCTDRNNYTDILHFYDAMRIYVKKRIAEGNFSPLYYLVIPAVYLRQAMELLKRAARIIFKRLSR